MTEKTIEEATEKAQEIYDNAKKQVEELLEEIRDKQGCTDLEQLMAFLGSVILTGGCPNEILVMSYLFAALIRIRDLEASK